MIEQVILLGLDDVSLMGIPRHLYVGNSADLWKPSAVIVDKVGLRKLFPGQGGEFAKTVDELKWFIGRELEMNDIRAVIVGICETTRTFQSNAVVYTTYSRAKQFAPQERKVLSYILAKSEPGQDPADVARKIALRTRLKAKTSEEFKWMTIDYYLKYTGIPINVGITTLLGFLVGTAIAGQTFDTFTLENLRQFGTLKAMGLTNERSRHDDRAPGHRCRHARLRPRSGARRHFWTFGPGYRAGVLHALATSADHGCRGHPDMHPG